jgi:hypothetical protein
VSDHGCSPSLQVHSCIVSQAVLICGAVQTATGQENQSTTESHRIEGGWFFTVTVRHGTPGPEQFQTLDSFAAGGGWSGHAATDSFTNWSPAYGTWQKAGSEYVITQYQFTQDPAAIQPASSSSIGRCISPAQTQWPASQRFPSATLQQPTASTFRSQPRLSDIR